jgi:oligo-1,6-glucosidase
MSSRSLDRTWWREAVVYQIYPRSFNDSNGDGVGDLPGIVEKLDYLDDLGVDVVWLNPVYESPNVDGGYDIADYRSIMDEFGTMADWERLLAELHDRGMKLIMDLVVNHTSDEHEWFVKSRAEAEPHDDYYLWEAGDPDEPPNNWESGFGGPAWAWDSEREEWYLHLFDERQPDLDWDNPEVRDEVFEMMQWWLEKGIDGFRMDVINLISKPDGLPDGDPDDGWTGAEHFCDGPRAHDYVSEMYDRVLADADVMTVGECIGVDVDEAARYVLPDGDGLSMIFHFDHVTLDFDDEEGWYEVAPIDLRELKAVFSRWQEGLEGRGWNSLYLGNHDWPRVVSRFGDDGEYRRESAKLLGTLLHTLQGTPYVYQGEELGMTNFPWESLDQLRDADARNRIELMYERGEAEEFADVKKLVRYRCRDNARTPMQWDSSPNAGFTEGDPWLPVNPNHEEVNVAAERADDESVWHYYRDLISLRDEREVVVYGSYDLLLPDHEDLWVYTRTLAAADRTDDDHDHDHAAQLLVVLNLSDTPTAYRLPTGADFADGATPDDADLLLGNYDDVVGAEADASTETDVDAGTDTDTETKPGVDARSFTARPWEARVFDLC